MMPAVLRRSGPDFIKDGVRHTPRALIQICEVCGCEDARFGHKDSQGKRVYFCGPHNPDRKAKGQGE